AGPRGDRARRAGDPGAAASRAGAGVGGHPQGRRRARGVGRRRRRRERRLGARVRRGAGRDGRDGGGGTGPHAHAGHPRHHGRPGDLPPRRGRGGRRAPGGGRTGRIGRGGPRGDRRRPGLRLRQAPGAQLAAARRTGHDRRAGLSCSRGTVAQAVPWRRHGAAGGGPRPRDRGGVRARVGARGARLPRTRRRSGPGGPARGPRHDPRAMNIDAYRFLAPKLWPDAVEILIVAIAIYRFLLFLVGTRAIQIVVGLVILSIAYFVAVFAKFTMISFLLGVVFTFAPFAAIVVFQPEIRNALARLGQSRLM